MLNRLDDRNLLGLRVSGAGGQQSVVGRLSQCHEEGNGQIFQRNQGLWNGGWRGGGGGVIELGFHHSTLKR